jgi:hypothetical protein
MQPDHGLVGTTVTLEIDEYGAAGLASLESTKSSTPKTRTASSSPSANEISRIR